MHVSRYHKFLRTSALLVAFLLLFESGSVLPVTEHVADETMLYVASVGSGMFASVPPNEINELSAQLAEQQRLLDAREAALREREIKAREYDTEGKDYTTYILSVILFLLTVLIVFNYALDWRRSKLIVYEKQAY